MKRQYFRDFVTFCFIIFSSNVFSQVTLFGDIYIAPKNEMHIASERLYFASGKIITDRGLDAGILSFAKGSDWENADHDTHVDGFIRLYDASEFSFPLGDNNVFQPIHLSDFSGSSYFDVAYHHQGHEINQSEDTIVAVSDSYFWKLRNPKGKGIVMLSWNAFSNIHKLLERAPSPESALDLITIGGFDGEKWIPIESKLSDTPLDEGTPSTLLSGLIQSKKIVDFSEFKGFTLMMRNIPALVSENVSQAITPNGDGKNDTWIIERIEQYPNAKVAVYNRWGEEVFSRSDGYNNDWAGNYKNNQDVLPTGPYLYVIDYYGDGRIDLKGWLYISD